VENINELVSLGTASFGILLASNVKGEKLRQALLEGAKNVLEKSSRTQKLRLLHESQHAITLYIKVDRHEGFPFT